jgi:fructose-specific phosphotransferase system IIC component
MKSKLFLNAKASVPHAGRQTFNIIKSNLFVVIVLAVAVGAVIVVSVVRPPPSF